MEQSLSDTMKCSNCKHCKYNPENGKGSCMLESPTSERRGVDADAPCFSGYFEKKEGEDNGILELKETYDLIIEVLKEYVDIKEEYYPVISLWIIGTYFHKDFFTYPYLFFNAMRGSGKTRLMKIIKELSWKGDMLASLSEAVLFRTTGTLCIDEFENLGSKEKNALRELINTAYKKGGKVKRMRKKKTMDGEEQVVEEFDTFRPLVFANISGIEEVIGDRCIQMVIEKSNNLHITRKIENFENHQKFIKIRENLQKVYVGVVYDGKNNVYMDWNRYIDSIHTHIHTHTHPTQTYTHLNMFEKIYQTDIDGRNLELVFPLLLLAERLWIIDGFISIIKDIVKSKKEEEHADSKDIQVFNLISTQQQNFFIPISELTSAMRMMLYDEKNEWLNNEWMGKSLKRLNLIISKKRTNKGINVILDVTKAKLKMEMFK
jgi:hypothetical protein